MVRNMIIAATAALALTAVAADARNHKNMSGKKMTRGSSATAELNKRQLASMDAGGGAMAQPGSSSTGGMNMAPASGASPTTDPAPAADPAPMSPAPATPEAATPPTMPDSTGAPPPK